MKNYLFISALVILASCGGSMNTEEGILENINELETSLSEMSAGASLDASSYKKSQEEYITSLILLYQKFPKSEKAPLSLDKVHMVYAGIGDYQNSTKWADTLLNKYPKYINRAMVLESQANSYDALIQPRDSAKVRTYYTMLLNEFPGLDQEKRTDIERRLQFNKLNFNQYIELQMLETQQFD